MAYTDLGRCASSGAVYAINLSFSVFNSNIQCIYGRFIKYSLSESTKLILYNSDKRRRDQTQANRDKR